MEALIKIISSAEFWKITGPALVAIVAWYFNERSKRIQQEYERKEESYRVLLSTIRGFYVAEHDTQLVACTPPDIPPEVTSKGFLWKHQ
jgi:hypothetical protein